MITRRNFFGITAGAGASLALTPELLRALRRSGETPELLRALQPGGKLIQRAIPSSGEKLPVIGLGFSNHAGCADPAALKEVLKTFVDNGGRYFDTNFANEVKSQDAIVAILNEVGVQNKLFLSWRGYPPGPPLDPAGTKAYIETSLAKVKVPRFDMVDLPPAFDSKYWTVLKELKKEGRVRYVGVTCTDERRYGELEAVMRNEPLDFIGVDYAIDNREVETTLLPLARERKIGVLVYAPFGRTRLWARVAGREVPAWAADFDARTWAQFFLKFVASHPDVTAVTPATSRASNMADNLGAAVGRLPNAEQRKRMIELVDALPPAPQQRRG